MNVSFSEWIKLHISPSEKKLFETDMLEKIWSYEKAIELNIPQKKRNKYTAAISDLLAQYRQDLLPIAEKVQYELPIFTSLNEFLKHRKHLLVQEHFWQRINQIKQKALQLDMEISLPHPPYAEENLASLQQTVEEEQERQDKEQQLHNLYQKVVQDIDFPFPSRPAPMNVLTRFESHLRDHITWIKRIDTALAKANTLSGPIPTREKLLESKIAVVRLEQSIQKIVNKQQYRNEFENWIDENLKERTSSDQSWKEEIWYHRQVLQLPHLTDNERDINQHSILSLLKQQRPTLSQQADEMGYELPEYSSFETFKDVWEELRKQQNLHFQMVTLQKRAKKIGFELAFPSPPYIGQNIHEVRDKIIQAEHLQKRFKTLSDNASTLEYEHIPNPPHTDESLDEFELLIQTFSQWKLKCRTLYRKAKEFQFQVPPFEQFVEDEPAVFRWKNKINHYETLLVEYNKLENRAKQMLWKRSYPVNEWSREHLLQSKNEMAKQEELYEECCKILKNASMKWRIELIQFPLDRGRLIACKESYELQMKWKKKVDEIRSMVPMEEASKLPVFPLQPDELTEFIATYKTRINELKRSQWWDNLLSFKWLQTDSTAKSSLELEPISISKPTQTLKNFLICKFPVTQALYEEVTATNPSYFKADLRPVEKVNWTDAILFCNMLSAKAGLEPVYIIPEDSELLLGVHRTICNREAQKIKCNTTANGYRLPTVEEWKYAANADMTFQHSGGDNIDDVGWYVGNSNGRTHDVGQKKPNPFDLYDMSGNVYEWCWDTVTKKTTRVICGGSWTSENSETLIDNHKSFLLGRRTYYIGFRVVRTE